MTRSGVRVPASACYSRPGYGRSTERAGLSVADAVDDVTMLLAEFGVIEFGTFGWSGGGPYALACAGLMAGRCLAATLIASPAPYEARGLDFLAGMEPGNLEGFNAAVGGFDELDALPRPLLDGARQATGASLREELDRMLPSADEAALTDTLAEEMPNDLRHALEAGIDGWRDDILAGVKHWGFAVFDITVPVAVWHGREGRFVPFAHGGWLAAEIPGAEFHPLDGDGHISPGTRIDQILANLVSLGGSPPTHQSNRLTVDVVTLRRRPDPRAGA